MGESTTPDEKNPLGNVPPEARTRVTAEDVRNVEQETQSAYSKLMDKMEANVNTTGQYFVKFGVRNFKVSYENDPTFEKEVDTRALLLISPHLDASDEHRNMYIVITRMGSLGLKFLRPDPKGETEKSFKSTINSILEYQQMSESEKQAYRMSGESLSFDDLGLTPDNFIDINDGMTGPRFIFPDKSYDMVSDTYSPTSEIRPVDPETVTKTIAESQKKAEIPHAVKLQSLQSKLGDAKALSSLIEKLPPKTA